MPIQAAKQNGGGESTEQNDLMTTKKTINRKGQWIDLCANDLKEKVGKKHRKWPKSVQPEQ